MRKHLVFLGELLASSFWIIPLFLTLLNIAFVFVLLFQADALWPMVKDSIFVPELPTEATHTLLTSIATSVMTVIGVLFSITIVVLQQVSEQYSPRVIENFIRSLSNKIILGLYVGTFSFCMLLLRVMHWSGVNTEHMARLGSSYAIVLAIFCVLLLIYFIHHLTKSIKSNTILATLAKHSVKALNETLAEMRKKKSATSVPPMEQSCREYVVYSKINGYLQEIAWDKLDGILPHERWIADLKVIPGDYIYWVQPLIVIKIQTELSVKQQNQIRDLFKIDLMRTHSQDLRFGFRQMADIGLKTLSPGINDPSTAHEALNEIGSVLLHFVREYKGTEQIMFGEGGVLTIRQPSLNVLLDLALNEIAVAGGSFYVIQEKVKQILTICLEEAKSPAWIKVLEERRNLLKTLIRKVPGYELFSHEAQLPLP